ncbi:tyrosine-type recombinase/integrase [Neolewinella aurantiaca]|uniref:Tyrosine-type recombinase/integrase n=2 Tax=Neolewinella aurantiaca TaxID=2602767 RepID=A0A5C7F6J3_9BACT|nr:tyrosine-type recombinase/integrase [Neolewinella aurantiaca]
MTSSTIINYARSLRDLMEYHHAEADAITARDILAFLAEREKSIGKSTLNTLCCALKYFFGKVLGDPDRIVDIPTPRKPKQLGELLTTSELKQLFAAAKTSKHRLVLSLIYGLGLRAGEVARIRLHDFDARHRTLIIRNAKGGKQRTLPYDEAVRRELIAYFRDEKPADYLFTSTTRKSTTGGISVRGVQYIVRAVVKRAGLTKKVCPHTLRHCFAVQYLNHGGNLIRLKQLLGHAHFSTTFRYLSYASPELKDIPSPLSFLFDA